MPNPQYHALLIKHSETQQTIQPGHKNALGFNLTLWNVHGLWKYEGVRGKYLYLSTSSSTQPTCQPIDSQFSVDNIKSCKSQNPVNPDSDRNITASNHPTASSTYQHPKHHPADVSSSGSYADRSRKHPQSGNSKQR